MSEQTFKFSEHGIKNVELFSRIYSDFIAWVKTKVTHGTFSTYIDGEPVCFNAGAELPYSLYLKDKKV